MASAYDCIFRFLYDSLITVFVGPEEQNFDIHKSLACHRSEFFKIACNGSWAESDGVIRLPEQDVPTFKYFIHWLYTQRLGGYFDNGCELKKLYGLEQGLRAKGSFQAGLRNPMSQKDREDYIWVRDKIGKAILREYPIQHLVNLFVLADKLQVRGLKDPILDQVISTYAIKGLGHHAFWENPDRDIAPMIDAMNIGYKELPKTSKFPQLLIHMYCLNATDEQVLRDSAFLDHAVLVQAFNLTQSVYHEERTPSKEMRDYCQYHTHDGGSCIHYVPDTETDDERNTST